jgi:very-short-patch-repair endonuclease
VLNASTLSINTDMSRSIRTQETKNKITANNIRTWKDPEIRKKRLEGKIQKVIREKYKGLTEEEYYNQVIKPLIYQGLTFNKMKELINVSNVHARTLSLHYGTKEDECKIVSNMIEGKKGGGRSGLGRVSPNKGKTYEEIFNGDIDAVNKRKEQTRQMLKRHNHFRGNMCKVSKPQYYLYEKIKNIFNDAEIDYKVQLNEKKTVYLDVAIPSLKLNVEYDGKYWHSDNGIPKTFPDEQRDKCLAELGWKVLRVKEERYKDFKKEIDLFVDQYIIKI